MGNYVDKSDILNWPSGTSDSEKDAIIAKYELFLEKITGTHFYAKNFDLKINGNNKNRIFLALEADIISITAVYVCSIEVPLSWIGYDEDSIYLDPCGSGGGAVEWGEMYYILGSTRESALFTRGYNNCRFIGAYGQPELLPLAKQAVTTLIEAHNDGSLDSKALFLSEKIGDYTYKFGGTQYGKIYTGIREVDQVIELLIKNKPVILTP